MAKPAKTQKSAENKGPVERTICRNKKAGFEYEILDRIEAGLVLTGTEVKTLRGGRASLDDSFARVEHGEVWLYKADIPVYAHGNIHNHEPKRKRKLLLNRREIAKFAEGAEEKGFTLVPLRIYFKGSTAKLELALCKGKKLHDKRATLKKKDVEKEIRKVVNSRRIH